MKRSGEENKTIVYFKTIENAPARRKLAGFLEYARMREWNVQTVPANIGDVRPAIDFWKPDGCVVNSASGNNNFNGGALGGVPSVFIDRPIASLLKSDSCIYHDSPSSVRLAMRHLLRRTPASCAYVSWPVRHAWEDERRAAYEAVMETAGLPVHIHRTQCGVSDAIGLQREFAGFIATLPKPAAVLAAADPLGVHVIAACHLAGCSVPDDVSVVGIDNDLELCESSIPALSSVAPDHFYAGRRAAEVLDDLIHGGRRKAVVETYANPAFASRGSSLVLRRSDHIAVAAMENIRLNACSGISAKYVLSEFGCSRRNAEYRFRAATGLSPAEAIRKVRYARALELLRTGANITVSEAASLCGYSSIAAFSRFFKSMSGKSPTKARNANQTVSRRR